MFMTWLHQRKYVFENIWNKKKLPQNYVSAHEKTFLNCIIRREKQDPKNINCKNFYHLEQTEHCKIIIIIIAVRGRNIYKNTQDDGNRPYILNIFIYNVNERRRRNKRV